MDSITQAALGGALGGAVLGRRFGRGAVIAGALLGTLPDMDVLIDYGDAVANFSQHRGFSHSLLILVPLAVVLAALLSRWRREVSFRRWLLFTGAILITHPLLDAFTTYGTQLLWPLGPPVAWHSIFIIDPLYTLPLLLAVIIALVRPPAVRALSAGLVLSSLYLAWSLVAQQWVDHRVHQALAGTGYQTAPRMVQPMPFSTLLWRATVLHREERLEIVTGLLDGDFPLHVERFPRDANLVASAKQLDEGRRLEWFTGGFLDYRVEDGRLVATDIRLGVPGAHPFQFVIAEAQGGPDNLAWQAVRSTRLARPMINEDAWPALFRRTFSLAPVLCLHSLQLSASSEGCLTPPGVTLP
jgi:inner membrane protein